MIASYAYNPSIWPALFTLAMTVFLGLYAWQRRNVPGARPFAIGCLFAAMWALGTAFEVSAVHLTTQLFWIRFQAVWLLPVGTAFPCFVLAYAGLGRWLTRRNLFLLSIPPVVVSVLAMTNDYHHLLWTAFPEDGGAGLVYGPANWFIVGYAYILGLLNITVLVWLARRSPLRRRPVAIMLLGQMVGRGLFLVNYAYPTLLGPSETVLVVLGSLSTTYAIAFFRFHVLDPTPLAHSAVIEQMSDGMLVLDMAGRIVDLNSAAARMVGGRQTDLRGSFLTDVLPVEANALMPGETPRLADAEITLGKGRWSRSYNLNVTSMADHDGRAVGHLLLLHDVTEQKRAQAKIVEQERVVATLEERERLAHELHDGIGQILGYITMQAQSIRKLVRDGKTEETEPEFTRLLEAAQDSQTDIRESILNLKTGTDGEWSFPESLRQYVSDFQSHHHIRTRLLLPDGLDGDAFEPGAAVQLLRVIQEGLTNVRKHSYAGAVTVAIGLNDGQAHITIEDDGVGFAPVPAGEDNGRHFGLAFMRERMREIGGSVSIDSRPGRGTVVSLNVPAPGRSEEQ